MLISYNYFSSSTYDFSSLYTTFPKLLFKINNNSLLKQFKIRLNVKKFFIWLNAERAFSLLGAEEHKKYNLWTRQIVIGALVYREDNVYIRFGFFRQVVGFPMGTNCVPLLPICFYFDMTETPWRLLQSKTE